MAKKEVSDKIILEIKKLSKSKNLIIGTERTIKNLKLGRLKKVFTSSNCPEKVKGDISYYGKLAKTEIVPLKYPNEELGTICKKPFPISVLGLMKE
ncbi:ribosomal L7Ae/L30e/S12e/Gadd45 family protein [Candidatus Woesearchaeota archaeon]|nr:ribosomal L7Ae/L30e/S12e/Gadd45 family protein [Candidatus Woesearchaeota archaeon]